MFGSHSSVRRRRGAALAALILTAVLSIGSAGTVQAGPLRFTRGQPSAIDAIRVCGRDTCRAEAPGLDDCAQVAAGLSGAHPIAAAPAGVSTCASRAGGLLSDAAPQPAPAGGAIARVVAVTGGGTNADIRAVALA